MQTDMHKQNSLILLPTNDDDLEAKMGDVLVFLDDAAHPHRTVVASAYTRKVYYTLFTDAAGSQTRIAKGTAGTDSEAFDQDTLLATVSTAHESRLRNACSSRSARSLTQGVMTLFRGLSPTSYVGCEKNSSSDVTIGDKAGSPNRACIFGEKTLVQGEDAKGRMEEGKDRSLTGDVPRDQEMLMVIYGKGAPAYVKDGLRMEKHS